MIKRKAKPCKGSLEKTRGFGCGELTSHRIYGLGKMCGCYSNWLLNSEQGKIKMAKSIFVATKDRKALEKAKIKKHSRRTLSVELEKTKKLVHKFVRLRDVGKPCISSLISYKPDFDAGHCYPADKYTALKFDLDNIHGQSVHANRFLEGDHTNYILNLPNRIGNDKATDLAKRAARCKRTSKNWTIDELKSIQNKMKKLIKNYE